MTDANCDIRVPKWVMGLQPVILAAAVWAGSILVQIQQEAMQLSVKMEFLREQDMERKHVIAELSNKVQKLDVQVNILTNTLRDRHDQR